MERQSVTRGEKIQKTVVQSTDKGKRERKRKRWKDSL